MKLDEHGELAAGSAALGSVCARCGEYVGRPIGRSRLCGLCRGEPACGRDPSPDDPTDDSSTDGGCDSASDDSASDTSADDTTDSPY